jgi:hypothetical protein
MKKLSPVEKEAKMSVLKEIMHDMDSMMKDGLDKKKGMKVSVMSDSPKGVAAGLEKAEDMLGVDAEDDEEDGLEAVAPLEAEELTEEEIDAKIQELLALKKAKSDPSLC